jgi:hypothetical protein
MGPQFFLYVSWHVDFNLLSAFAEEPMANETAGPTAHVNGTDLWYEVAGSGEPLLLLHGGGGTPENWAYAGRDSFLRE